MRSENEPGAKPERARKFWVLARRLARDDEGSTLVLTIGFAALALALIIAVAAATSLLVERRRLYSVADGAALAAAEAFALQEVRYDGTLASPALADAAVDAAAKDWVRSADSQLNDVTVEGASADSRSSMVSVSSYWRPPMTSLFLPEGLRLDVTVTGRSIFVD